MKNANIQLKCYLSNFAERHEIVVNTMIAVNIHGQ
jgi:hypothetical protein